MVYVHFWCTSPGPGPSVFNLIANSTHFEKRIPWGIPSSQKGHKNSISNGNWGSSKTHKTTVFQPYLCYSAVTCKVFIELTSSSLNRPHHH